MNHFEYVMVLVSIIIGLGIAHILLGTGGIVDRLTGRDEPKLRVSVAHAAWLAHVFLWLVLFWWWQFRLEVIWGEEWEIGVYLFLITYAVVLFFLAVLLVPRSWEGVTDLNDFFLRRRVWFYSTWILAVVLDFVDGWLKGGQGYVFGELGAPVLTYLGLALVVGAVGIRSRSLRYHAVTGVGLLVLDYVITVGGMPTLGF